MAAPDPTKQITAWSFSRWNDYQRCPALAKYKYVLKIKEPDNVYMARGSAIHKLAEQYALKTISKLPPELNSFKAEFAKLRKMNPITEGQWAFDRDWKPTSWFGAQAWCRIMVDATAVQDGKRWVIDHKTGKQREEHRDQLGLYALGGFLNFPEDEIEAQDWYLDKPANDDQKILGEDFVRTQLDALKTEWEAKTKIMLLDQKFSPKPNDGCRFCHFRKSNGGPCKF